ncbi:MAG: hypothetical protein LBL04_06185 [Bacteroidales bacterium]|jgi:hypothetical protein|nr:hypothetical protein [Bacteroidales bacterium]
MKTIIQKFGFMVAVMAMIFTGCKDDGNDPVAPTFSTDIVSVAEGSSATATVLSGTEPFTVESSAEATATAKVDGKTITVTGIAAGTASVTVTGSDGGEAKLSVAVTQKAANAPTLSATTVDVEVDGTATVTVSGGTPAFTVRSSDENVARATVSGTTVSVQGISGGTALITVEGSDNASSTFAVTVNDEQIFFGPDKKQLGNGQKRFHIKKSHTIRRGVYTMVGWIYVEEGATLTIEPGAVIRGSNRNYDGTEAATGSTLIIMRGAKIMAEGTPAQPIVFTSAMPAGQRQASDWGGIILCGKAKNNQTAMTIEGGVEADHGGSDDDDNSGVMRYCRIEFGGYPYSQDNEINGLTLGSVGRGTTIDHIQVSYAADDSFEWFGGTVNCKYLVAYHGWDDDFDTDNGFSGKIQFILGVRDPKIADQSNTNGFESDNKSDGGAQTPNTSCVFSNVTLIGPLGQDDNFVNHTDYINGYNWGSGEAAASIRPGIFQAAMQIRRNSHLSCFNSVFTGYPVGLMLSNEGRGNTQGAAADGLLKVKNVFFAGMGRLGADADKKDPSSWEGDISANYFSQAELNNRTGSIADLKLKQFKSKKIVGENLVDDATASWAPLADSPLLGAADFTDAFLNHTFFSVVTYSGAFSGESDNWMEGWTNFDPQNTEY